MIVASALVGLRSVWTELLQILHSYQKNNRNKLTERSTQTQVVWKGLGCPEKLLWVLPGTRNQIKSHGINQYSRFYLSIRVYHATRTGYRFSYLYMPILLGPTSPGPVYLLSFGAQHNRPRIKSSLYLQPMFPRNVCCRSPMPLSETTMSRMLSRVQPRYC